MIHSRHQVERLRVEWSYRREVTPVEGGDAGDSESLGCGDDRCVHRSERKIAVLEYQFGHPDPIACYNRFDGELTRRQITEEPHFGLGTQPTADQVEDLGEDQGRNDQRAGVGQQEVERRRMVAVVGVDIGVEGSCVDQDRFRGTSAARISSIRSEMSSQPLRPAAAARRWRRRPPR